MIGGQEIRIHGSANVTITGASGYLGRSLVEDLMRSEISCSALMHSTQELGNAHVKYVYGDLLQRESISGWLEPNQSVVHLAYMWSAGEAANLESTKNLLAACRDSGVKRVVHVSTAAVVGRSDSQWVDETTPCRPVTEYGRTKLKIEQVMRDFSDRGDIDVVLLRPTSVFGPGGAPLEKLCRDLRQKGWAENYLRACLFGGRAMNLVHIDNVVAAIRFAIDYPGRFAGGALIISDDDAPANNFRDVEMIVRDVFQLGSYPIPLVPLSHVVLESLLRVMGRNIVDSRCRFSSARIRESGFVPPMAFEEGLIRYAEWARCVENDAVRNQGASCR
jgi:nucleoside-diphosphate-sugar epimerase